MATAIECPNCKRLQAEVDGLKARISALEEELRRGRRQAAPFGRDRAEGAGKKPGRKPGQGEFARRESPPPEQTETLHVPLDRCPHCGGPIEDRKTHENFETDLPIPLPRHRRYLTESGWCPRCRRRVRSRHPEQSVFALGAAAVGVGPNLKAIAADLHHRLGVPYAKVADHLAAKSGVTLTPSALCQSDRRLADKLRPVYAELVAAIRQCCAVHADETGWRIGTLSAWLWVFTSKTITVYVIDKSRGHEVVVEILGREFRGVLVGDCFLAYDHRAFAEWIHQKCFAHFLKDLSRLEQEKTRGAVRFPREAAAILRDALALRNEKPKLSSRAFAHRLNALERRIDAAIAQTRRFSDPDNRRFAKRLRKHRAHLFTFLRIDGVEPTNNRAERMLRPAVVVRKTGACNKTQAGAETHSILSSVLATAKQRAVNGIAYLASVLTAPAAGSGPTAVPSLLAVNTS